MFVFIDMILSHALGIPVHVTCKQGWAGQPVQRCSRICTALVSCPSLEMGFSYDMAQNVIEILNLNGSFNVLEKLFYCF